MRTLFFILTFLSATLSFAGKWTTVKTAEFSISHPKDWTTEPTEDPLIRFFVKEPLESSNDAFAENFNFLVQPNLDPIITLDSIISEIKGTFASQTNAEFIYAKRLKKSGMDYGQICVRMVVEGMQLRIIQKFALVGNSMYLLTFVGEDRRYSTNYKVYDKVIESFQAFK
ncbi:MAG: hypothetical protein K1X56_06065 [Flavobacteriales bacterium]|nr:hypothetical protein [Flavobacteriales bacterium]